jgi:serine protease Do
MNKVIVAGVTAVVMGLAGSAHAQDVLQLRGPGSQIGVMIAEAETGVTIQEVRPGTAAERAGFKRGDVVVTFDGQEIRSGRQFRRVVEETRPGKPVTAIVMREGSRQTLSVTPEAGRADSFDLSNFDLGRRLPDVSAAIRRQLNDPDSTFFTARRGGLRGAQRLGVEPAPLSPQLAQYFGVTSGVLVSSVDADSPAARAGLRSGDVITAVDGRGVTAPIDLTARVRAVTQGETVELKITRDKRELTLQAVF